MRRWAHWSVLGAATALVTAGTSCRPSGPTPLATHEVDRTTLPIAEPPHREITNVDYRNATPPPRFGVQAPPGAPNVLIVLLDDLGFGASQTFGGVVHMPTLERLAAGGLIYNNFHVNPIGSASRVALLTGRNSHSANMRVLSEFATAYPPLNSMLPRSVAPLAKILKLNGYNTAMFGKSHEYAASAVGPTGPFDEWPTRLGFERFYGSVIGESSQFAPVAYDNTTLVPPSRDPHYYYQTDIADRAIEWIRSHQTLEPDRPFFIYYAAPGTHTPVQVPAAWRDRYKGTFDRGWDVYRQEILARQKQLGIVPPNTELAPKPEAMPDWDALTPDEKRVAARHQEIFAAFAEVTDYEIGRVVRAIEDLGVLENTMIIYVTGDNGANTQGGALGHFNSLKALNQVSETLRDQLTHLDQFGGPASWMTPPLGWAIADNTPFAYGQFHTQYGGTTNGMVVFWPRRIHARREMRNQYHHLIDIAPTVLEVAGLPQPKTVEGSAQRPLDGVSMVYTFDHPKAKSRRRVQYYEYAGNRGIYKDKWFATTLHKVAWEAAPRTSFADDRWTLCDTANDFSCAMDVSAEHPYKHNETINAFATEAAKYNVLPLDDRAHEPVARAMAGHPVLMEGRNTLTVYPGMVGIKEHAFIDVKNRSSTITAHLEIPPHGASGVVLAQGGAHNGWSLYVKDGRPAFAYNVLGQVTTITATSPLPAGAVTIAYEFAYDGGRPGAGGVGTLWINGRPAGSGKLPRTVPHMYGPETADVGVDLFTAVTTAYAAGDNRFTGAIHKVTIAVQ